MAAATTDIKVDVCVVGCGVSGAVAAAELVEAGVEVLVVEAGYRAGGRLHTISHDKGILEMGAQWIHGQEGNCIYEWAKAACPEKIGTDEDLTQTGMGRTTFVDHCGNPVPHEVSSKFQVLMDTLKGRTEDFSNLISVGDVFREQFSVVNEWGITGWEMLEWYGRFESLVDGAPSWYDVSAPTISEYWECAGNPVVRWTQGGYQTLVDHLVNRVGSERILLKSPVLKITWNSCYMCSGMNDLSDAVERSLTLNTSQATNSTSHGNAINSTGKCDSQKTDIGKDNSERVSNNTPHISDSNGTPECENQTPATEKDTRKNTHCIRCGKKRQPCILTLPDRVIVANHVIFSGSLGVLKSDAKHMFEPALPPEKLMAIEGLGFDTVAKVYLQFSERWWPLDTDGFSFMTNISGPPLDPRASWWEQLLGFYTVSQQPLMLCAWISGPAARAMEQCTLADVLSQCHCVLQRRLRNMCKVTAPVWGTRSVWGSNPYTRGAYSYRSVDSDSRDVWASDLASPLTVGGCPVVCFCGEATHSHYYSTVHGAWETGVREAQRLLQYWRGDGGLYTCVRPSGVRRSADTVTATNHYRQDPGNMILPILAGEKRKCCELLDQDAVVATAGAGGGGDGQPLRTDQSPSVDKEVYTN